MFWKLKRMQTQLNKNIWIWNVKANPADWRWHFIGTPRAAVAPCWTGRDRPRRVGSNLINLINLYVRSRSSAPGGRLRGTITRRQQQFSTLVQPDPPATENPGHMSPAAADGASSSETKEHLWSLWPGKEILQSASEITLMSGNDLFNQPARPTGTSLRWMIHF